jgi:uncharacterized NAD-dependent epimerase/dehydratase family protein
MGLIISHSHRKSGTIYKMKKKEMKKKDAEWIVIRGQLSGHNDTPYKQTTLSRPIGCPGLAALRAYFIFSVTND